MVTLTATVKAGSVPVKTGQVNFCDASAKFCTDIHLLATAQLTSTGTATFKLRPGIGSRSYKAVFAGTPSYAASASSASPLKVTSAAAKSATSTSIAETGYAGNYTLTATVTGTKGTLAPTGTLSFVDTTTANSVIGSVQLGTATAGLSWLGSQTSATGREATSIAAGDFNGDGIADLAVVNNDYGGIGSVTIYLGNGDGTFKAAVTSPATGDGPVAIAVADFNGDGKADLAVLNQNSNSITILLGNGDGTFTAAFASPATGNTPYAFAVADFNGDGIPDLAVVNNADETVSILLGNGDGTFTAVASTVATGKNPQFIAVGDFNGDGKPDLAVVNQSAGTLTIALGNGDGTFKAAASSPAVSSYPNGIAVADFNADGKADLAIADANHIAVTILLGNGDGTFTAMPTTQVPTIGGDPYSVAVADFNGDGIPDIAVTDWGSVTILIGNGDGTFTPTVARPSTGSSPEIIAIADFNGDGVPDVAMAVDGFDVVDVALTQWTGTATLNVSSLKGPGPHLVDASYPGDSNYAASKSATVSLMVQVATPVIAPPSGSYTKAQTVTITCATAGATIYYETLQSNGWVKYTAPFQLSSQGFEIVQAYATATGYQQSWAATATIVLNFPQAATPVISLASGVYSGTQSVTITDTTPGAKIYYTTNGTTPTSSSALYGGAIKVSSSETLVASAIATGFSMSSPATAQYLIGSFSTPLVYTFAGNGSYGWSGDGGPATSANLNYPGGTARDSAGNLYIADEFNNVVRKVAVGTGLITTIAGTGVAGFSGDNGPAASAQLNDPVSVAVDSGGNLYIADSGNCRVRQVAATTGVITTYAGNGLYGSGGDSGPATSASVSYPQGIAVDGNWNLYIADAQNDRIRKVTSGSGIITTVAGIGSNGYTGDGGPAVNATLDSPEGVAADGAGNLYIADKRNNVIRRVDAGTGTISTVAGNGYDAGAYGGGYVGDGGPATSAELYWPQSVAIDGAANLYIADTLNQAIRKVAASSGVITTVVGNGAGCDSLAGDGAPATSVSLCNPQWVSSDAAGNLFVSDILGARIFEVVVSGIPPTAQAAPPVFSVSAGTYASPQTVTLTDATPGAAIYLTTTGAAPTTLRPIYNGPINVTGTITIKAIALAPGFLPSAATTATYTITAPPTAIISTVAGNGVNGMAGLKGPATSASIGLPTYLTVDSAGNIYFADNGNNVVWMVTAKTGTINVVAGNGTYGYSGNGGSATSAEFRSPSGVAVDSAGNIYIADTGNNVVRKVAAGTGIISVFAGGQYGYPGNIGDGGPATSAALSNPYGLAIDSAGNLYIADYSDQAIRKVSAATGIITTVAGNGNNGFSGDGGPATSASLSWPAVLALDSAGNLYFSDFFYSRIRKVAAATGIITTVAGDGDDQGSSGDGGPALDAEINAAGLAVDPAGNIYLSNFPGSIRRVDATTGLIGRMAGNGYFGYFGDGGSATVAELADPTGIAFDTAGNLYIADGYNYRIRKVVFPGPAPAPAFKPAAGTYASIQNVAIADSASGAIIYYTTDGTTPTTLSSKYSSAIPVAATETINAIAVAPGYTQSNVATAAYTIDLPTAAAPVFKPIAGTYTSAQTVTLSDATAGATIYYTTNGTVPTTSSTKYTSAGIKVAATETIEAFAVASGYLNSATASAAYTIATAPTVTTSAATSLSTSGATLNGTVTANNATTQYWFAYGTNKTALTSITTKTGALTGTTATPVTASLTGLKTKTTYYFQVVASNAAGTASGTVLSFTTN
jgi:hypothetical protein